MTNLWGGLGLLGRKSQAPGSTEAGGGAGRRRSGHAQTVGLVVVGQVPLVPAWTPVGGLLA